MAQFYVATDGLDINAGTSWALAKATLESAVTAAASGDTINIASGVYTISTVIAPGKTLTFQGVGKVVLQGAGSNVLFTTSIGTTGTFNNIIFKTTPAVFDQTSGSTALNITNCVFDAVTLGVRYSGGGNSGPFYFANCQFLDCATAGLNVSGSPLIVIADHCSFIRCAVGIDAAIKQITNSIFYATSATTHHKGATLCDYNLYNIVDANRKISTSTSLSAWQGLSANNDPNSVVDSAPFADYASGVYHLPLTSANAYKGFGGTFIGALPPALVLSANVNASTWNAPSSSTGLEQSGAAWGISNVGVVGTYVTPVLNLSATRGLRRLMLVGAESPFLSVFDYVTTDSAPRQWTLRYRGSNTAFLASDGSPAWVEVNRQSDLLLSYQYLQIEVTLRANGL